MVRGGIDDVRQLVTYYPRMADGALLATLCRFDDFSVVGSYSGPFIPWERRIAHMEISRIQGRDI